VCEKKSSPDPWQTKRSEIRILGTPESVPSTTIGNVSSPCPSNESSLKKRNEKRARDESPPGPHSDLIIEVFGSKCDNSKEQHGCGTVAPKYIAKAPNKTAEERENALTAASALLGLLAPST